ncbi:uncharacterized protein K460DRAFT_57189 [Cucurbitaria berberidis CBS 394.84]|uniref:Uncharacterized protein n=1 Tax=Cucurbitaria berberidis CBS 394.84 TaxID=1168544 RepID=A0A9P4GKK5_9PLEO|nr:uncharacterized protein K460DRAFT_57189 [Cucurbitaria berberidis CBS 394.84]KAF1847352.1 hypothetical protein K460DRAFT_57189 [Cucurbitaria berberidis CBS 394.84]
MLVLRRSVHAPMLLTIQRTFVFRNPHSIPSIMGLDPIYLIIKSSITGRSTKPYFRIADTLLPGLPKLFRYSHNTNKYDELTVTASPSGEDWIVLLEYNNQPGEEVEIYEWYKSKEEAEAGIEKKMENLVDEGRRTGQVLRPSWTHDKDTKELSMCSYHTMEPQDGAAGEAKVYYWWQVVQVNLTLREQYDIIDQKQQKERAAYMAKAESVALDMARRTKGELSLHEEEDLERRERSLGVVNLTDQERLGMDPMGDEERERRFNELRSRDEEDGSSVYQAKTAGWGRRFGLSKEQQEDPEIMGVE